jgi:glutathione S-transferase
MKIYHDNRTRSIRVLWAAEEMGLDIEVLPGELGSEALMAINPMNTLPVFVDGDVVMTESMGIVEYLAGRYGPTSLVPGPDGSNFAAYKEFVWLGESSIGAFMTPKILNQFFAPEAERGGWIEGFVRTALPKRIAKVRAALDKNEFVAGPGFTAADISVVYALNLLELIGLEDQATPDIVSYRERLQARPAFKRAMAR